MDSKSVFVGYPPLAVSLYGHTPEPRFLAHLAPLSSGPGHPEGYPGPITYKLASSAQRRQA